MRSLQASGEIFFTKFSLQNSLCFHDTSGFMLVPELHYAYDQKVLFLFSWKQMGIKRKRQLKEDFRNQFKF